MADLVGHVYYDGPDGSYVSYRVEYSVMNEGFYGHASAGFPLWFAEVIGDQYETGRMTRRDAFYWVAQIKHDMARHGKDTSKLEDLMRAIKEYTEKEE